MTIGYNRALKVKGINEKYLNHAEKNRPCIFLSHISLDKGMVRKIADYIMKAGIDIYLDENDEMLQEATKSSNDDIITTCIQKGIRESTHVLCLLSDKTVKSWWVPYEIGYGDMGDLEIASMKLKELTIQVPSYLKIRDLIQGIEDLNSYLIKIMAKYWITPKIFDKNYSSEYSMYENASIIKGSYLHPLINYLNQ